MIFGREAGFMLYGPLALFPIFLAGAPWFPILLMAFRHFSSQGSPPIGDDLTVLSPNTLLYHAIVLVSFAINVALIFSFLAWCERQAARSGRK